MHKKAFFVIAIIGLLAIGAASFYSLVNFTATVAEGETAIVIDDEGHFVEALGPGFYWTQDAGNVSVHPTEEYSVAYSSVPGYVLVDGVDETRSTDYGISINLLDAIKYAQAHPEFVISKDDWGIQNAAASAIANTFNAAYSRGDIEPIRFISNSEPSIMTDAASSASYIIEKAEADAKLAAMPTPTPVPALEDEDIVPRPSAPLSEVSPTKDPSMEQHPTSPSNPGSASYRDKYEFRCWTLSGSFEAGSIQSEFLDEADLTSYDSITLHISSQRQIVRETALPCGFLSVDQQAVNFSHQPPLKP